MTIYDYIYYYKDITIKDVYWNDLDNMLCAILSYLPIKQFEGKKDISEVVQMIDKHNGDMETAAVNLLKEIENSNRYKKMKLCNYKKIIDSQTQFVAITIRIGNITCISFKGSDGSTIGWHENFRLSYLFPTNTQIIAANYLKESINFFDMNIHVVGHSKGGNLAIASILCSNINISRIKSIVNFDGPGFLSNEKYSTKYKSIENKITTYLPENSYVGILLYNDNIKIIKTLKNGLNSHFLNNWECFGNFLVKGNLSKESIATHKKSIDYINSFRREDIENVIENFFGILEKNNIKNFNELTKLKYEKIKKLIDGLNGLDTKTKNNFFEILKLFINPFQ